MRDPEFALEERSIQILTDPYKSILVSGILPKITERTLLTPPFLYLGDRRRDCDVTLVKRPFK